MMTIWEVAKAKVDNKSVSAQIGHSSMFHMFRSASKSRGSAGAKSLKLLGQGVKWTLTLIPIPGVKSLAGNAAKAIETAINESDGLVRVVLLENHTDRENTRKSTQNNAK